MIRMGWFLHECSVGLIFLKVFPVGIYLLKVNNKNTKTRYEICSKLAIKTPERRYWHKYFIPCPIVFILLTLNIYLPAGLPNNM